MPESGRPYLLFYARRYNRELEAYAIELAKKNGWRIVEISLRAVNAEHGHEMRYDAGVEEFLGLVKNASYVVTNSYHGMIMSFQYGTPFKVFSREQCDTKIAEVAAILGVSRMADGYIYDGRGRRKNMIQSLNRSKEQSMVFLKQALEENF